MLFPPWELLLGSLSMAVCASQTPEAYLGKTHATPQNRNRGTVTQKTTPPALPRFEREQDPTVLRGDRVAGRNQPAVTEAAHISQSLNVKDRGGQSSGEEHRKVSWVSLISVPAPPPPPPPSQLTTASLLIQPVHGARPFRIPFISVQPARASAPMNIEKVQLGSLLSHEYLKSPLGTCFSLTHQHV